MIINEKNREDVITAYVYGELNETELAVFEAKKSADADFAEEVELYVALIGDYHEEQKTIFEEWMEDISLDNTEKAQLPTETKQVSIEGKSSPKMVSLFQNRNRVYAIAAALLLFLSSFFLFKAFSPSSLSAGDLVATHLEEIHKAPSNKMGGSEEGRNWASAKKAYEAKDYEEAAVLLEKIAEEGTTKAVVYFYLGLSYLYQPNVAIDKTISAFGKAASDVDYKNESYWYMSLAHLRAGESEKAVALLKKLEEGDAKRTFKHQEAVDLLEALKKN